MNYPTFAIRSLNVITKPCDGLKPATILVRAGKVKSIEPHDAEIDPEIPLIDVGSHTVMPGIVDAHAHINEPGRTEWEGFDSATAAAAAGGITTVIDMPLNSIPPTTTLTGLRAKQEAAHGRCHIDYGFWGGVIPGNTSEFPAMVAAGALGFKAFTCHSGVDEFPMSTAADLRVAMPLLAKLDVPLLVHAELESADDSPVSDPPRSAKYSDYLKSRPQSWEVAAINMVADMAAEFGTKVHIVHLSAADALDTIRSARRNGAWLTVETCPHYLTLCAEEIPDGATWFKCAPPIREKSNRERLWQALGDGVINCIVSDHSPCTPQLKLIPEGDFTHAWGGIAGLQFSLSAIWTEIKSRLVSEKDATKNGIARLVEWMSFRTAELAGISHQKGALTPGHDADFVIWDPDDVFTVEPGLIRHRHKVTPYNGMTLNGKVLATFVRGQKVYEHGTFAFPPQFAGVVSCAGQMVTNNQYEKGNR